MGPPGRIDAHGDTESQPILSTQENSGRALSKSGLSESSRLTAPSKCTELALEQHDFDECSTPHPAGRLNVGYFQVETHSFVF